MSDKIDQRIVEMSFENHKFEKGISQSKKSFKEFTDALDKSDVGKNLSGLENTVTSISNSFSILEQIGIGSLRRIGENAVDAGAKLIKGLSVDQLSTGWDKYEKSIASTQTILNATGKSLEEVNGYLDELAWFSDETSYGIDDMEKALASMTATGGDIEKLIPMITGVANATAFAGKGAAEFSRVMQFGINQAYSLGSMQVRDWSTIESATVNSKQLIQTLIAAGEELGKIKKGQVTVSNFRNSLADKDTKNWLDKSVMEKGFGEWSELSRAAYQLVKNREFDTAAEAIESLAGQFSYVAEEGFKAAQTAKTFSEAINATKDYVSSGWKRTYKIIFGDIDEAKERFTELTAILWEVFASTADQRNEMLAWLKKEGGIANVFQGIKNASVALLKVLKPISEAFDQIFPPKTKEQWLGITEAFKNFTEGLIISEEVADKIKRTFAGLFAVVDIGWQALKFLGSAAFELIKVFIPLGGGFLGASASLGDFLVRINQMLKSSQILQYGLLAIKIGVVLLRGVISNIVTTISDFVYGLWTAKSPLEYLANVGGKVFSGLINGIKMVAKLVSGTFLTAMKGIQNFINSVVDGGDTNFLVTILTVLRDAIEFISGPAVAGFQSFGNVIRNLDFSKIATFVTGGILLIFIKQLSDLTGAMTGLTNTMAATVSNFNKKLFAPKPVGKLKDLAYALGILTASIWILSRIPAEDLKKGLIGVAAGLGAFVAAYALLQTVNVISSKIMKNTEVATSAFGLVGLASSLLIMSMAIKNIGQIDEKQAWTATKVMGAMVGFVAAYQLVMALLGNGLNQQKFQVNLLAMSTSLLMFVGVIALINLLPPEALKSGLDRMTSLLVVIATIQTFFAVAARISGGNKMTTSLLGLAGGIVVMLGVLKLLAFIDPSLITNSLGNLTRIVLIIASIELLMGLIARVSGGKLKSNILTTTGGILAMVGLIAILGMMKQETIDRGIINLAKMAGIVVGIELLTSLSARIAAGAKVQKILGSVSFALLSFTGVIAMLGVMKPEIIDQGMLTLKKMVGLIAVIEMMTALASRIGGGGQMFGTLIGSIIAILTLTTALALLSMVDQEALRGAVTSLAIASVAMLALGIAVQGMSKAFNLISASSNTFFGTIGTIIKTFTIVATLLVATAGFFYAVKTILPMMDGIDWNTFGIFTVGMGAVATLLVMLNKIPLTGSFKNLTGLLPAMTVLTTLVIASMGFFKALQIVLPMMNGVNLNNFGMFITGIGFMTVLMGSMTLLIPALAKLGGGMIASGGTGFLALLAGIGSAIFTIGTIVLAIVGLAELLNVMIKNRDALTRGLDLLVEVGGGIGRFIGAFAGGTVGGILEGIGASLSGFANALGNFSPESLQGVKALAEALLIITGASIMDGINKFITGKSSSDVFGEQIKGLVDSLRTIKMEDAQQASNILSALTPMAQNLKIFAEAANSIPPSAGLAQAIMGNTTLDEFGKQLSGLVSAFLGQSSSGYELNADNIGIANSNLRAMIPLIENLETFSAFAKKIPASGGFVQLITGNTTLDEYGEQIHGLVSAFIGTTSSGYELNADNIGIANSNLIAMLPMIENLTAFIKLTNDLPASGGWKQFVEGNTTLSEFGSQISTLNVIFEKIKAKEIQHSSSILLAMTTNMLPAMIQFSNFAVSLSGGQWGNSLSEFGKEFKKFIESLKGTNFDIVAPAINALNNVTATFQIIGQEVIANAKASFDNNKAPFQKSIATIFDSPINSLNRKKKDLVKIVSAAFKAVTDESDAYAKSFEKLGENVIEGLKKGMNSKKPSAIETGKDVMKDLIIACEKTADVGSPSRVFATIGGWCTKGLANGLSSETKTAVKASTNVAKAVENGVRDTLGVHSLSDLFSNIGGFIPKSLGSGIQNGKASLLNIAESLGISTGDFTIQGAVEGVSGGAGSITSAIDSLIDILTGTSSPSSPMAAANAAGGSLGGAVAGGLQNALSDKKSGVGGSTTQQVIKTEIDKLRERIEKENFYGRSTLKGELLLYAGLREKYPEGSPEREALDREVWSRLKKMYEAQKEYIDETTKAEEEAVTKRTELEGKYFDGRTKYANDIYTANLKNKKKIEEQEKNHQEEILKIEENAAKERSNLWDKYLEDQKSIKDQLKADIVEEDRIYTDALKSRSDAIYNYYGLFAKVEKDAKVTGEELLQNLRDQNNAYKDWEDSLAALSARGVSSTFIEELQSMGVSSKGQIKALLNLSDGQLVEYMSLYRSKNSFAKQRAETELEDLKQIANQNIENLKRSADSDLSDLDLIYRDNLAQINSNLEKDLGDLRATNQKAMEDINDDYKDSLKTLKDNWQETCEEIDKDLSAIAPDLKEKLDGIQKTLDTAMQTLPSFSEEDFNRMITENETKLGELKSSTERLLGETSKVYTDDSMQSVLNYETGLSPIEEKSNTILNKTMSSMKEIFANAVPEVKTMGINLAAGFASGITAGIPLVLTSTISLISKVIKTTKTELDEHSPSRVFAGIGKYVSLGLANGIQNYAYAAENASKDLAQGPILAISSALSELEDSNDFGLTITPVLDLSKMNYNSLQLLNKQIQLGDIAQKLSLEEIQNGNKAQVDKLAQITNQSNTKMLNALEALESRFSDLVAKVGRLQVVMDTGAVVGAIGPEMDEELGRLNNFTKRGVR